MSINSRCINGPARWFFMAVAALLLFGCAHHVPLPPESFHWAYQTDGSGDSAAEKWAPVFVAYGHAENYNRIGRPSVRQEADGDREIFIDTQKPAAYFMQRSFTTAKDTYTNLIYRVHFPKVPFSLIPFNLTAGSNVGILLRDDRVVIRFQFFASRRGQSFVRIGSW